jgi:hypothetical protein
LKESQIPRSWRRWQFLNLCPWGLISIEKNVLVAWDCAKVVKDINAGDAKGQNCMIIEILQERRGFLWQIFAMNSEKRMRKLIYRLAKASTSREAGRYVWLLEPPEGLNIHVNISNLI